MGTELKTVSAFAARAEALQKDIEVTAETSRSKFSASLGDLVRLQQEEIERLQSVIDDATKIPPRRVVQVAVGSAKTTTNRENLYVVAVADDGSLWQRDVCDLSQWTNWHRIPPLPTLAEEAEKRRRDDDTRAITERARRESADGAGGGGD